MYYPCSLLYWRWCLVAWRWCLARNILWGLLLAQFECINANGYVRAHTLLLHRDNRTQAGFVCTKLCQKWNLIQHSRNVWIFFFLLLVGFFINDPVPAYMLFILLLCFFFSSSSPFLFISLNSFYKCIMHVELFCVPSFLPYVCLSVTNNVESFRWLAHRVRWECVFYPLLPWHNMICSERRIMAIYTC